MTIFNKIRWAASIMLVFAIVLVTNLVDREKYDSIRQSITTIYEDRIVASDLIFELSLLIQEKELAMVGRDSLYYQERYKNANREIEELIRRYQETKLTEKEKVFFSQMRKGTNELMRLEDLYTESGELRDVDLDPIIVDINNNLRDLSKVQLEEGKRQMDMSNKAMETIDLFTQVEIIFLVIMAILVQIIILYKRREA